jgi:CRP-like cAMP-binding protein
LHTKEGNLVVLPNNLVSREPVTNYSSPEVPVCLEVEVGATYLKPPNEVKAAIHEAIERTPLVLRDPAPEVLLMAFADSAITYRARMWTLAYDRDYLVRDQVRTAIYYAFRRNGVEIPYPIQVEYSLEPGETDLLSGLETRRALVARVAVLAPLTDEEREVLAANGRERLFADGEIVVRQDAEGRSMFVVAKGTVQVVVEPGAREVARLREGDYFGEMSLLAGAPRNATVRASGDTTVLEITADVFRQVALGNPAVVERVGEVALRRQRELDETRAAAAEGPAAESASTFVDRIRKFLRLTR